MPRTSLRQQFREDPRVFVIALAGTCALYAAIGVASPRWLTAYSRHPVRNAALSTVWRVTARSLIRRWAAWLERTRRSHDQLVAELGREPTPEELVERMEALVEDRS